MGTARDSEQTRAALIAAAGELFAAHGFAAVTARQVAARAKASLSTIPYHFGSMEALYREALLVASAVAPGAEPLAAQALAAEPAEGLRLAVRWVFADLTGQPASWQLQLITRECLDPSPAFRDVVRRKFRPEWEWLAAVAGRAAGRPADDEAVQFGVLAMYTLASTFFTHRAIYAELAPAVVARAAAEPFLDLLAALTVPAVERYAAAFPDLNRGGEL
jgi:AcrR family transcriptional regulator